MIFIKEEAGYRYFLNPWKPNKKFRLGEMYEGIRTRLTDQGQQKILLTKYSMISQKTVDNLKKQLKIIQKIRDSANIPSSILKYYGYLYNLAQSNLYIISQYFDKFIPLELKELHPVNLITIVSDQILSAFQYLQSIQLFTTYFNIFINDNLQVKIFDFGFEFAVDSLNFEYQAQSNACVDWVWGYLPNQKNKQIYDQFVKENLIELNDQKLEKGKTQKLYSWLYGLIIYNKMCSTLLNDQKYRLKKSTGEYWYPWCYLLKCLFIKKQFVDYSKKYKMISTDIVNILKKFQSSYSSQQVMQNMMMEQNQISRSEQILSQYFKYFTDSGYTQHRLEYPRAQIQSNWIKMIVELLKVYVFQPFNRRVAVSEIKKIIHGSTRENNELNQSIIKYYLITNLQKQQIKQQIQGIDQQHSNKQTLQILWKSKEDLELQTWLRRFQLEPEKETGKVIKKKEMITVSEKKKLQENTKQILFPYLKSIYVNRKQLKRVNSWLMNRLNLIDLYEQIFKNLTIPQKQSRNLRGQGYRIINEENYQQLQHLKPMIKQLILIGIYLEIISILNEIKYERKLHQKIKHNTLSQMEKNNYLEINRSIMDALARQQNIYNGQVCLYVKIRHSLKIKLHEIHKMVCQYNYLMDSYLCKYTEEQQHMGQHQYSSIEKRYLQTFFKKVTNLIVITKIHEKVLSLQQIESKQNKQNLVQYHQFYEQYQKANNMFSGYALNKMNSIQVDNYNQLKNSQELCIFSYFLQMFTLIMLGCMIKIRKKEQIKMVEGANSHTLTFITSFLKQNRRIIETNEKLRQLEKDIKKIKKVVQYLIISNILIPGNSD